MNGLLLVNKPLGITSFDVIRRLQKVVPPGPKSRRVKIGHAGTLDPLASGLMLILIGSATKQAGQFSKLDKRYSATIELGANSTTGDAEGEKTAVSGRQPSQSEVEAALAQLTGQITQTPSVYSAIKIKGQEAYKRARRGETVEMPSRTVTVHELKLVKYDYPTVQIQTHVSSGTYIRSLAEDLGELLSTGAYLSNLVRTEIGQFKLDEAVDLGDAESDQIADHLISVA